MIKPKIEIQTSKENDTYAKIAIPDGCPYLCVKLLKEALCTLEMKKETASDDLRSHKYEDWISKNEIYKNSESSANIIYQQYVIHLIATAKTKEDQQKLISELGKHFTIANNQ